MLCMAYIDLTDEQTAAMAALKYPGPVTMVNLVRFKEGDRRQYEAYGEASRPLANKYGARVRYLGEVAVTVIGNDE